MRAPWNARLRLPLALLGLTSCVREAPPNDPVDARAGLDAALRPDGGATDSGLDAPLPDAAPAPDVPEAPDADLDASVVTLDAGRDAGLLPDAHAPADAPPDAGPSWAIGFCRVQFPTAILASPGMATTVYGRVYAEGLTTRTGATDADALLLGEVGSGPDGSLPSSVGWTWARAAINAGYGPGAAGYEPNNDEYEASLSRPGAGSFDFAFRFSGDGGLSWTYCDTLDAGSSDGYQLANAGSLTVM